MRTLPLLLRPTAALRRLGVQWAFVALLAAALMPTISRLAAGDRPDRLGVDLPAPSPSGPSQDGAARARRRLRAVLAGPHHAGARRHGTGDRRRAGLRPAGPARARTRAPGRHAGARPVRARAARPRLSLTRPLLARPRARPVVGAYPSPPILARNAAHGRRRRDPGSPRASMFTLLPSPRAPPRRCCSPPPRPTPSPARPAAAPSTPTGPRKA